MIIIYNSGRDKNRLNYFRSNFPRATHLLLKGNIFRIFALIALSSLRKNKDVINIIFVGGPIIFLPFFPFFRLIGLRFVYDTYDFPRHKHLINYFDKIILILYAWLINFSDELIFLNDCYFESFRHLSGSNIKSRVTVLPPIPHYREIGGECVLLEPSFIYVGHFARVHRIEQFLLWYSSLAQSYNVKFHLIGYDRIGRHNELKSKFSDSRIKFWGRLEKIDYFMRPGNIGVGIFGDDLKSVDSETNKILEYMNAGMLVVTGKNKVLPRLFPNAPGIFYVTNFQEFLRCIDLITNLSSCEREALGRCNNRLIKKLSEVYPKKWSA
jgi:hypothetical protein